MHHTKAKFTLVLASGVSIKYVTCSFDVSEMSKCSTAHVNQWHIITITLTYQNSKTYHSECKTDVVLLTWQVDLYRPASHCHSHHLKPFRNCFRPSNIYTFTKTVTTPKVTHSSAGVQTSHSLILFSAIQIDTSGISDTVWWVVTRCNSLRKE